ncbi:MAG: HisA/HisF-related TIM barrel protein, partial [Cyclobacteriaceae bacterium]
MEIIPAIDIIDGKCVRLTKGDYNQKTEYFNDPVEVAQKFAAAGIKRLHLVDLDGARQKKVVNIQTLKDITANTSLIVDFGGGVKSRSDLEMV